LTVSQNGPILVQLNGKQKQNEKLIETATELYLIYHIFAGVYHVHISISMAVSRQTWINHPLYISCTGRASQTSVVYPPMDLRPKYGRWAPHQHSLAYVLRIP